MNGRTALAKGKMYRLNGDAEPQGSLSTTVIVTVQIPKPEVLMRITLWLLTLSLLALVTRYGSAEDPRAGSPEGGASAVRRSAAHTESPGQTLDEVRRLRQEVEELRARTEQLGQAIGQSRPRASDKARVAARPMGPASADTFQEAKKTLARYKQQSEAVREEARGKIRELRTKIVASLRKAQERYCRDAKLDEAVAIRDRLRRLETRPIRALPDPGILHVEGSQSQVLYFRVTGSNSAPVWGTDVYTADASLAAAAVHAGVLKVGQTGIVKVTTIPQQPSFEGSFRNGIQSSPYSSYAGFIIEPAGDDGQSDADEEDVELTLPAERPARPAAPPALRTMPMGGTSPRWGGSPALVATESIGPSADAGTAAPAADADLPPDAREVVEQLDRDSASIWKDAHGKIGELRRETIRALAPLQDALTRDARLDEAVAVRDCIRALKQGGLKIEPDPGRLVEQNLSPGTVRYFRVVGANGGSLWGTGIYTADSTLAAAAVHAGVLRLGERGVVKVTILPGQSSYAGSDRNGVTSSGFASYPSSYRVARVADIEPYEQDLEPVPR